MPRTTSGRARVRVELLVFAAALLVRLAYLLDSADNPTFTQPIVDSRIYDSLARTLASGGAADYQLFWQPFFYPAYLAALYALGGSSIVVAKVVQILLGSATCALVYRLGRRLFDVRVGVVAAAIVAVYGPLIFFETELVAAGWAAFWSVALVLLFLNVDARERMPWSLGLGLAGAAAVLTRPTFLPFFTIATAVWAWRLTRRRGIGVLGPRLLLLGVGFAMLTVPVAAWNHEVTGSFSFLPASGGVNLFLGNYPKPCETVTIRPGTEWAELNRLANPDGSKDVRRNQSYFLARAAEQAVHNPLATVRGLGRKAVEFVSSREIPRNLDPYLFRAWSPVLSVLMWKVGGFGFPFGVLLPLAFVGLVLRGRALGWPSILFLVLVPLAVVLVFVSARYRVPVIPVLAIPAAAGVVDGLARLRKGWSRGAWLVVAGAVAVVVLASAPGPFCEEKVNYAAEMWYAVGYRWHQEGQLNQAIHDYDEAIRLRPDYAEVYNQLALAESQKGRTAAAMQHWRRAIEVDPDFAEARINLGAALARQGDYEAAIEQYRRAIAIWPENGDAHHNLAVTLAQLQRFDEAMPEFALAMRYAPKYIELYSRLAAQYEREGRTDVARALQEEVRRARAAARRSGS